MTDVQLPNGTALDADGNVILAEANTERVVHDTLTAGRLIERWKNKAVQNALLASYAQEVDELEAAIWAVLLNRWPPYAAGVQQDIVGRIVGEDRNGLSDDAYTPRIQARIAMNASFGRARDILNVLSLVTTGAGNALIEEFPASFRIVFDAPTTGPADTQYARIVSETRAAGIGATISAPTGAHPFTVMDVGDTSDPALGFSSAYGGADGGVISYEVTA